MNELKFIQEDINNQKTPISTYKIKFIVKNISRKKTLDQKDFIGEFYKTSKEDIIRNPHNLFQKKEEEGTLSNHCRRWVPFYY